MPPDHEATFFLARIRDALRRNNTETPLGQAVVRLKQPFVLGDGKKRYYEGFVSMLSAVRQVLATLDDSISPDLPPFLLDPATIARMFGIPLEEFNWQGRQGKTADAGLGDPDPPPAGVVAEEAVPRTRIVAEAYLTLTEAAKTIPGRRPGKRVSLGTLWRWCTQGLRNGIRLKSVLVGGQRCTTRQWLQEFIEAMSQASQPETLPCPVPRTPNQRQAASERAAEELKAAWEMRKRPPL